MPLNFSQNPPLSLYIHIPWCVKKCPYCDFNSHLSQSENEMDYIQALIEDLEQELPLVWGRKIESIFIGGGTPSLFSAHAFEVLLSNIRARIGIHPQAEITLESNPGTAEADKFKGYKEAGITRLSLGIQSFNDVYLQKLGRIHDAQQAFNAINFAKEAGFKQINLDIMYGLPEQTLEQALNDLNSAISHQPQHISWYQLTIEPNTYFYSKPPPLPDQDLIENISLEGIELLSQKGYKRYEVSAFAQQDCNCFHNLNYWQFGDYLGIGAGAHSKITHVPSGKILRRQKAKIPQTYLNPAKPYLSHEHAIDKAELPLEFMLNALRLPEGVKSQLFQQRTGLMLETIQPILDKLRSQDLLKLEEGYLKPSSKGFDFLNHTLSFFDADEVRHLLPQQRISIKNIH